MRFSVFALLTGVWAHVSFAGSLQVIDHNRHCLIWSDDNYGCTGYSAPFAPLNGDDCSGRQAFDGDNCQDVTHEYQELSEVTNGIRHEYAVLNVDACGTIDGLPAAWIHVNQTGLVTFSNQDGDQSSCTLDNGLKVGSSCISSDLKYAHSPSSSSVSIIGTTSAPVSTTASTSVVASTCACYAN
jgi:hypothetical protein